MKASVERVCDLDSRVLGSLVEGCDEGFLVCSCLIGAWRYESQTKDLVGSVKSYSDRFAFC